MPAMCQREVALMLKVPVSGLHPRKCQLAEFAAFSLVVWLAAGLVEYFVAPLTAPLVLAHWMPSLFAKPPNVTALIKKIVSLELYEFYGALSILPAIAIWRFKPRNRLLAFALPLLFSLLIPLFGMVVGVVGFFVTFLYGPWIYLLATPLLTLNIGGFLWAAAMGEARWRLEQQASRSRARELKSSRKNAHITTAVPGTAVAQELVSLPPNWHWSIVLVLGVLTRQLFNMIWVLLQANWACKLSNDNKPLVLVAMYPVGMIAGFLTITFNRQMAELGGLFIIAGAIVYLVGIFSIKEAMEDYYTTTENIGLQLNGVMTFFFSTVYIQYHINNIARWKQTGVLK